MQQSPHEVFIDFFNRFISAEDLGAAEKALVFVGNTRAGKSTLACAASGSKMMVLHDIQLGQTELLPCEEKFKDLVKSTLSSVTEKPNFFLEKGMKEAVVDMPGYADSSRMQELINFHYITKMISNMQQVRFVMVIGVAAKPNGSFELDKHEIKMMENFMEMFKQFKQHITLLVNKFEATGAKDLESLRNSLISFFGKEELLLEYKVKNPREMKEYYREIVSNVKIIARPPFRKKENSWNEPAKDFNTAITKICFTNNNTPFVHSKDLLESIRFRLFKDGQDTEHQRFIHKLKIVFDSCKNVLKQGVTACKKTTLILLSHYFKDSKRLMKGDAPMGFLRQYPTKPREEQLIQKGFELEQSVLVLLLGKIMNISQELVAKKFQRLQILFRELRDIFSHLLRLANCYPQFRNRCAEVKETYILMVRSLEIVKFLWYVIGTDLFIHRTDLNKTEQQLKQNITQTLEELNAFHNFDFKQQKKEYQELMIKFQQLVNFFLSLDIRQTFKKAKPTKVQDLKAELQSVYNALIQNLNAFIRNSPLEPIMESLQKKLTEIRNISLVYIPFNIQPNSKDKDKVIQKLLNCYTSTDSRELKLTIVLKVASSLEQLGEFKKAIGLYLHLQIYEKVMALLKNITEGKDCAHNVAVQWYSSFSKQFQDRKRLSYFEKCMEMAKALETDADNLIQLNYRCQYVGEQLSGERWCPCKSGTTTNEKLELWNWKAIDNEVAWLKTKLHNQNGILKNNNFEIIAKELRNK